MPMDMKKKMAALSEIMKKASKSEEGYEKEEAPETPHRIEDDLLASEAVEEPSESAEEYPHKSTKICPHCGQAMPDGPKQRAMLLIMAKGKDEDEEEKENEESEGSAND